MASTNSSSALPEKIGVLCSASQCLCDVRDHVPDAPCRLLVEGPSVVHESLQCHLQPVGVAAVGCSDSLGHACPAPMPLRAMQRFSTLTLPALTSTRFIRQHNGSQRRRCSRWSGSHGRLS
jgi:hypothetical protein